jgi:beta-1,4-mannosyltransferase
MMSQPAGGTLRDLRVAVVVLGDLGRSPRMQYHARALAAEGAFVDLVGEPGTDLPADLEANPRVHRHHLTPPRAHLRRGVLNTVSFALRLLRQSFDLLYTVLVQIPRPHAILVQNPPAVPTLLIVAVVARLRRCRMVVDWHNLGYALVAAQLGRGHWGTRLAELYERRLGPRAESHLCVSRAMQQALQRSWGIEATVLYDEPAEQFQPVPAHLRTAVLSRVLASCGGQAFDWDDARRPAVIVTSTSWTPDEDFELLVEAAVEADRAFSSGAREAPLPDLLIVVTGAGRLRAAFEERVRELRLPRVHLRTVWLSVEDYASLLGAADLGLSLHRSASGIDLPMKVADMFGAGLPVCALDYGPCLRERIEHRRNGLLFSAPEELVQHWIELFGGFPAASPLLAELRRGVAAAGSRRWTQSWREHAAPIFAALR